MSGRRDGEFTDYVTERMWWLRRLAYLLCRDWQQADGLPGHQHRQRKPARRGRDYLAALRCCRPGR